MDSLLAVLQRWVHLAGRQVQFPAEGDSHHIHVVSAVPEGAGQSDENWKDTVMNDQEVQTTYLFRRLLVTYFFDFCVLHIILLNLHTSSILFCWHQCCEMAKS